MIQDFKDIHEGLMIFSGWLGIKPFTLMGLIFGMSFITAIANYKTNTKS